MNILGLDPGSTESALALYEPGKPGRVLKAEKMSNDDLLAYLNGYDFVLPPKRPMLVIEDMQSFGMPVGREVFEAVRWTGRFDRGYAGDWEYITRKEVMLHLCGSARGNDANIRQALIDRWGGSAAIRGPQKCKRCGGKGWYGRSRMQCGISDMPHKGATPAGALHGISGDQWSALAIAVAYAELHPEVTR